MKIVERKDIDVNLWDQKVAESTLENPTMYSEVLDLCSDYWCAIVNKDYSFLLPLTYTKKFGIKRLGQQSFGRQVDFIGSENDALEAIEIAKSEFKIADLGISSISEIETTKRFQKLKLDDEIGYSKNAKRILKKNGVVKIDTIDSISEFVDLYRENSFTKFKQNPKNPERLNSLIDFFLKQKKSENFGIYENNQLLAGISLIYDKKTCYYLLGDADPIAKKNGSMFVLMDFAIGRAKEKGVEYFDFGGSNINSVATFYHKMGGSDYYYTKLSWNRAPFWYNVLKRIR